MNTTGVVGTYKVLIVEDDLINRKLINAVLKKKGYAVIEAQDGMEGLRLAVQEGPDVILMDIRMPVMDGVEALRGLREAAETMGIPVIAQTAFAMKGDRERFLSAGFDDYIPKPFSADQLDFVIRKHKGKELRGEADDCISGRSRGICIT